MIAVVVLQTELFLTNLPHQATTLQVMKHQTNRRIQVTGRVLYILYCTVQYRGIRGILVNNNYTPFVQRLGMPSYSVPTVLLTLPLLPGMKPVRLYDIYHNFLNGSGMGGDLTVTIPITDTTVPIEP